LAATGRLAWEGEYKVVPDRLVFKVGDPTVKFASQITLKFFGPPFLVPRTCEVGATPRGRPPT